MDLIHDINYVHVHNTTESQQGRSEIGTVNAEIGTVNARLG